jgi:hypothetical protein
VFLCFYGHGGGLEPAGLKRPVDASGPSTRSERRTAYLLRKYAKPPILHQVGIARISGQTIFRLRRSLNKQERLPL